MPPDLTPMIARVTSLREQCARGAPAEPLLGQIEDVLSAGYAQALAGDAWSISGEKRLQQLISEPDQPSRARLLQLAVNEHAHFQRELIALRRELAGLRRDRSRICADSDFESAR